MEYHYKNPNQECLRFHFFTTGLGPCDIPMFLIAVCLILRCSLLGRGVEVYLDPRWMGVPGTQWGLRCQLRHFLKSFERISCSEIVRLYTDRMCSLMYIG